MPTQTVDIRGQLVNFEYTDEADLQRQAALAEQQIEQEENMARAAATGTGRTVLEQGLQGATFGLSDEALAFAGALGAKTVAEVADILGFGEGEGFGDLGDRPFSDIFEEALQRQAINLAVQQQERPGLSLAANIGGGLLGGGAALATAPGRAAAQALRTGTLAERARKGALIGGASAGAFGFGQGSGGLEERAQSAIESAPFGIVGGGVTPAIGAGARSVYESTGDAVRSVGARLGLLAKEGSLRNPQLTSQAVTQLASQAYDDAQSRNAVLKPRVVNRWLDEVRGTLLAQTKEGKIVRGKDDQFTNIIDRLEGLRDRPIGLLGAKEVDEALSEFIDQLSDGVTGRLTKSGQKVLQVQQMLRDSVERASAKDVLGDKGAFDALREGRRLWTQARKLDDVERIIERAKLSDNPATVIKTGFRNLVSNPKKVKGFTVEEKELLRRAAQSGAMSDAVRAFGSRLNPIIALGSGASLPSVAALQAGGLAARDQATRLQVNRAQEVAREISRRALDPTSRSSVRLGPQVLPLATGASVGGASTLINDEQAADILRRLEEQARQPQQ